MARIRDLARREASALHELDAWNVPDRERELVVERHVDQPRLAGDAEPREELYRGLRLHLVGGQRIDDDERALLHLLRERRAQRAALHTSGQREIVAARLRPEHRAAVPPQRIA